VKKRIVAAVGGQKKTGIRGTVIIRTKSCSVPGKRAEDLYLSNNTPSMCSRGIT